jgi:hypothetical protein
LDRAAARTAALADIERLRRVGVEADVRQLAVVRMRRTFEDVAVHTEHHLVALEATDDEPFHLRTLGLHANDDQRDLVDRGCGCLWLPEKARNAVGALLQVELASADQAFPSCHGQHDFLNVVVVEEMHARHARQRVRQRRRWHHVARSEIREERLLLQHALVVDHRLEDVGLER